MNDELTFNLDDKLEDALAMLAAGLPLEEVLAGAGSDAAWLRPLLQTATDIQQLQADITLPPPDASLQRLLNHGQQLAAEPPPAGWRETLGNLFSGKYKLAFTGTAAVVMAAALLVVFLAGGLLGGGLVLAAENSLPGQPLYGVKRLGETLRLTLAQDSVRQAQLLDSFNQRRWEEAQLLLRQNSRAEITLTGVIESVTDKGVVVNNLLIQIGPDATTGGQLTVGAQIRVTGTTQPPDKLVAASVTVIQPAPPQPTPTPSPTATVTPPAPSATATSEGESKSDTIQLPPTDTPTATATATQTPPPPTATPTATPANTATPLPTPIPTAGIQSPPTSVPVEDGNDNVIDNEAPNENEDEGEHQEDNSNDSSDDNSGSDSGSSDDDDRGGNSGKGGGADDNDDD